MLGIKVPHHQDGNPSVKGSHPTMGLEGEKYTAKILRVPLTNIIIMAVACNWVKPRTGTA
jgi:hypothetical protein